MTDWWYSLLLEKQIFYAIGSISVAILLFQMALTIFGLGGDDVDVSADHDSGLGLITIRTVAAFFVGFGWTGAILLNNGYGIGTAIAGGIAVGSAFLLATALLVHSLLRLQSSGGNINYSNAIGTVGTVYSTIPAAESGGGQLELLLQGRLMMAEAYTKSSMPLKPGAKARVVALIGQSTLLVEPLSSANA